jgi:hypothetical protein
MNIIRWLLVFSLWLDASERFIHHEGYVMDRQRDVLWQDSNESAQVKKGWIEAKNYCANLEIGGIRRWRLPTEEELLSIVDFTVIDPAIYSTFRSVVSDDYWTADRHGDKAQSVYFGSGCTNAEKIDKRLYVRCVRKMLKR